VGASGRYVGGRVCRCVGGNSLMWRVCGEVGKNEVKRAYQLNG
jgi:hypothetical protein